MECHACLGVVIACLVVICHSTDEGSDVCSQPPAVGVVGECCAVTGCVWMECNDEDHCLNNATRSNWPAVCTNATSACEKLEGGAVNVQSDGEGAEANGATTVTTSGTPAIPTTASTPSTTTNASATTTASTPSTTTNASATTTASTPSTTTNASATTTASTPSTTTNASATTTASTPSTTTNASATTTASTTATTTPKAVTTSIAAPTTTEKAKSGGGRKFDAASFVGGMVLMGGVLGIIFFACKYYKSKTENRYRQF